jgi:hypothetical protein
MSATFHGRLAHRLTLVAAATTFALASIAGSGLLPAALAQTHV